MTDDICGAECADGTPCEHPAGSCPVPSHSDPDAENPHGRDFTLGPEDHEDILEAAKIGASVRGCARAAGVSHSQLQRYLDANENFRSSFERARAKGEQRLIEGGLTGEYAGDEIDGPMARFLLSSSFEYVKEEKIQEEHSGGIDHGGDLEVTISHHRVTDPDGGEATGEEEVEDP